VNVLFWKLYHPGKTVAEAHHTVLQNGAWEGGSRRSRSGKPAHGVMAHVIKQRKGTRRRRQYGDIVGLIYLSPTLPASTLQSNIPSQWKWNPRASHLPVWLIREDANKRKDALTV